MNKSFDSKLLGGKLNLTRRGFLQSSLLGAVALGGGGSLIKPKDAAAFAYEPYPRDDALDSVVTSCAHNCGSRHMLVAHKKGDVIVRISTDDGRYQRDGEFGKVGHFGVPVGNERAGTPAFAARRKRGCRSV